MESNDYCKQNKLQNEEGGREKKREHAPAAYQPR